MTARELFEQLEKKGLADKPLFTFIEVENDARLWWDIDRITEWFILDGEVFLEHVFDDNRE